MSLEDAIRENTAAVRELLAAMRGNTSADTAPPKPAKPAAPKAAAPAPAPAAEAAAEVTMPMCQDLIRQLAAKNREQAVELLASFNAKKATDVKPADLAKFYADMKTALAA